MTHAAPPAIAVSTWSLHRTLGVVFPNSPANDAAGGPVEKYGKGAIDLLDLPAELKSRGYGRVEICHFNIRTREKTYLAELRAALAASRITLQTLLIDDGDIAHPTDGARDAAWCGAWIDAAAALGADAARVPGGRQKPSPEALGRCVAALRPLARRGRAQGVRVVTENWLDLLSGPREVNHVMDALDGEIGLIADTYNWRGPTKYDDLAAIMGRATSAHAKCHFPAAGVMDVDDYGRCLDIARDAGFKGPYALIYDGPGEDEWAAIAQERDFLLERISAPAPAE